MDGCGGGCWGEGSGGEGGRSIKGGVVEELQEQGHLFALKLIGLFVC